jgi:hypothetical protein
MDGFASYGALPGELAAVKKRLAAGSSRKLSAPALVGMLVVPVLIFTIVYYLRSFDLHYQSEWLCDVLCYSLLLVVATFAFMTANLVKSGGDMIPMALLTVTTLIWWMVAFSSGNAAYTHYMKPFYDINNLNVYPHVNPAQVQGNQLMDAGMIQFHGSSKVALHQSIGFKNENIYCVAPIVMTNVTNGKTQEVAMKTYDFWAVGINCCSGHVPDFSCGEYSNPLARWGLRMMDDDAREMFRLAVKEAEASYNLKASHPIFLHWMSDPHAEVDAYQDDGFRYFMASVGIASAVQLAVVVSVAALLASM